MYIAGVGRLLLVVMGRLLHLAVHSSMGTISGELEENDLIYWLFRLTKCLLAEIGLTGLNTLSKRDNSSFTLRPTPSLLIG